MTTTVIPTNNIQGDITSCGLEKSHISTERNGAFAVTQANTYQTYNLCTKEVVREYSVDEVTFIGAVGILFVILVTVLIFGALVTLTNDHF